VGCLAAEFQRSVGSEVEFGARHLQLAHPCRPFLHQNADRFLVAECRAGGERVLRVQFRRITGA
jgi:hypothetical protein